MMLNIPSLAHLVVAAGLGLTLATTGPLANAADTPARVVASLKPVELIIRAVGQDQVEVSTLIPDNASPHTYQLRPSERRRLENAEAVFWIGEDMETFLSRLLTGPDFRERAVALAPGNDGAPEESEENDEHEGHQDHGEHDGHGHQEKDSHGHGHDHGDGEDPHVWLDPALAVAMADTIGARLKTLEGVDAARVDQNLNEFRTALSQAEDEIRDKLTPARDLDLFTYHDAFSRFAAHYNLKIAGVLTLNPEQTPGAGHLADVQQRLRRAEQPCLLTEPQFNRQWWRSLMEGLTIPMSTWDPLAGDITASATGYIEFQHSLADAVLSCLPEKAQQ